MPHLPTPALLPLPPPTSIPLLSYPLIKCTSNWVSVELLKGKSDRLLQVSRNSVTGHIRIKYPVNLIVGVSPPPGAVLVLHSLPLEFPLAMAFAEQLLTWKLGESSERSEDELDTVPSSVLLQVVELLGRLKMNPINNLFGFSVNISLKQPL